jgi:hypothetical protein
MPAKHARARLRRTMSNNEQENGKTTDHERHAKDWHEWSTDVSDYNHKGEMLGRPKRLFVRNQDGACELIEAEVTSASASARELEKGRIFSLYLGRVLAEWLHDALGKAIAVEDPSDPRSNEELIATVRAGIDRATSEPGLRYDAALAITELEHRLAAKP